MMSMEINGNYGAYADGVTTSTVELKTSTPGVTKTEQIQTGFDNVNDYLAYLQGKYSYVNIGTTSMEGIPTTVTVSAAFLKQCMNDPEKAAYLEENLAAVPNCVKSAVAGCAGTLTNLSYQIDANGNITGISSGTSDPDGRIAKENAKRRAKEQKEKEERLAKRRGEERQKAEERLAKKQAERQEQEKQLESAADGGETGMFTITATAANVKSLTQSMVFDFAGAAGALTRFDVTA